MDSMTCSSCGKNKHELRGRKSALWPMMNLILCTACWDGKIEPRFVVVLYGRQHGIASVSDYIRNHKYSGAEILARELAS